MIITKFEVWECTRDQNLFDQKRSGRCPMPWDLVVLKLTTDEGVRMCPGKPALRER